MTTSFLDAVNPPTVTVKVKKAVPFLSVKGDAIRARVTPQFPAALIGGAGISVSQQNGIFTVSLDVEKLQTSPTSSGSFVILWDDTAKQFARVSLADLKTLMGL